MNWTCTQQFFYDFHDWVWLNLFHTTLCLIVTPKYKWRSVVVRPNLSSHLSHIKRESKVGGVEKRMKEEKTSSIALKSPVIGILNAEYQKYLFSMWCISFSWLRTGYICPILIQNCRFWLCVIPPVIIFLSPNHTLSLKGLEKLLHRLMRNADWSSSICMGIHSMRAESL